MFAGWGRYIRSTSIDGEKAS
ncbi:MAG: hypothetical protein LBQ14_00560 [Treponema sp.]|nr:hypothetical protein [Treponema sp.]